MFDEALTSMPAMRPLGPSITRSTSRPEGVRKWKILHRLRDQPGCLVISEVAKTSSRWPKSVRLAGKVSGSRLRGSRQHAGVRDQCLGGFREALFKIAEPCLQPPGEERRLHQGRMPL